MLLTDWLCLALKRVSGATAGMVLLLILGLYVACRPVVYARM